MSTTEYESAPEGEGDELAVDSGSVVSDSDVHQVSVPEVGIAEAEVVKPKKQSEERKSKQKNTESTGSSAKIPLEGISHSEADKSPPVSSADDKSTSDEEPVITKKKSKKKGSSSKLLEKGTVSGKNDRKKRGKVESIIKPGLGDRTSSAKKRGANLVKKAKEFETTCGGKVYLKAEYKGTKNYFWCHGKNFKPEKGAGARSPEPEIISSEKSSKWSDILSDIKKTINESFSKKKELTEEEPQPSTSQAIFVSPIKKKSKRSASKNQQGCLICGNLQVVEGEISYESEGIGCSFKQKGEECSAWVHSDCLGFPGVTEDVIQEMPAYYCRLHIAKGRKIKNVGISYVEQVDDDANSKRQTVQPKKKKKEQDERKGRKGKGSK